MPDTKIARKMHDMLLDGFDHQFGEPRHTASPDHDWQLLREVGTDLWLDTGDIEEARALWCDEFSALTTNNTLLNKEIQKGIYDKEVSRVAKAIDEVVPEIDERTRVLEIAFYLNAYHALRLVENFDARVSVELHTDLAHDVERSIAYGRRFFGVCPERFIVKVPLTAEGYLAARALSRAGVPINFTLGFSARQNYLAALLTDPSWVNVFMGRLNAFVADNNLGSGDNIGEKVTLSTQRELRALRKAGRTSSCLIGASMRTGEQVATLAGLDVYTMPTKVARQYKDAPERSLSSQVTNDPDIPLNEGIRAADFAGQTLWEVDDAFRTAVDALMHIGVDGLTPETLREHLRSEGCSDLLVDWSEDDVRTAREDGKIPVLDHWRDRLATGEVGLDALMNLSALQAFVTDQTALDERIRSLL